MGQHIALESGGRRLSGRLFEPSDTGGVKRGILFVHGLNSSQSGYRSRAEAASAQLDAVCLTFDLGGHRDSDGDLARLSPRDHLSDVIAGFDFLAAEDSVDSSRIGLCAASYGAYLAGLLVSRRPARRLLLRAPALYDDADFRAPLGRDRTSTSKPQAAAIFKGLARLGSDVLILESENDEVIPHAVIEAYLTACPQAQHEVILGALHGLTDPKWQETFIETILTWFNDL
jgi:pimeloyl-ACP methyl ester carboxylesterase